jgi:hypothetical protein
MTDRLARFAPFTGVGFALVFAIAEAIATIYPAPGSASAGKAVIRFYQRHGTAMHVKDILLSLAFILLLGFVGTLRSYLRRAAPVEGLIAIMPAVAAVLLAGTTTAEGIEYALANAASQLSPGAAQTLNVLHADLVLTKAAALCALGLISGLAILRAGLLPRWLGWLPLVMALLAFTPALPVALLLLVVWTLATAGWMWAAQGREMNPRPLSELSAPAAYAER